MITIQNKTLADYPHGRIYLNGAIPLTVDDLTQLTYDQLTGLQTFIEQVKNRQDDSVDVNLNCLR